jgi:hypothetical protein
MALHDRVAGTAKISAGLPLRCGPVKRAILRKLMNLSTTLEPMDRETRADAGST